MQINALDLFEGAKQGSLTQLHMAYAFVACFAPDRVNDTVSIVPCSVVLLQLVKFVSGYTTNFAALCCLCVVIASVSSVTKDIEEHNAEIRFACGRVLNCLLHLGTAVHVYPTTQCCCKRT